MHVWLGYALARAGRGERLAAVNLGAAHFTEGWHASSRAPYAGLRRSTLVMHTKLKVASHVSSRMVANTHRQIGGKRTDWRV